MPVLLRFRKDKIAIMSDIEAMFYQVKVMSQHRDSLSFLWWPEGDLDKSPVTYRMTVHSFGATSSPSCATFPLGQSAKDFGIEFEPYVANAKENCFYVDDCLLSVPDSSTGIVMVNDLRSLLSKAGFRLTKWLSNRTVLMESLPEDEWSKYCKIMLWMTEDMNVFWASIGNLIATSSPLWLIYLGSLVQREVCLRQ